MASLVQRCRCLSYVSAGPGRLAHEGRATLMLGKKSGHVITAWPVFYSFLTRGAARALIKAA